MEPELKYVVHIGYAKAASSLLQKALFSGNHEEISIVRKSGQGTGGGYAKSGGGAFLNSVDGRKCISPFSFDPEAVRRELSDVDDPSKPLTVISNEVLAGHPFSGGVYAKTIAERIKDTLPDAKILIVFREQRAMLLSTFAHFVIRGQGRCSLGSFLNSQQNTQIPWHNPEYYCFSQLVGWYQGAFGRENVLALPMEVIRDNPKKTASDLAAFLGVTSVSDQALGHAANARDYGEYAALRLVPNKCCKCAGSSCRPP